MRKHWFQPITKRLSYNWHLIWHGWWKPVLGLWFLSGAYDFSIAQIWPNFGLPTIAELTMDWFPVFGWGIWVFIGLVLILLSVMESAYRMSNNYKENIRTLEGELNSIKNTLPNIRTELEVSDKRFSLVVHNIGGGAGVFTASGRVIVGKPKSGLYVMYWDGLGEKCQINGMGGIASILVAEKLPDTILRDAETSIYKGELALFKWGTSGKQTFPVHTFTEKPVTVNDREGVEIVWEDKCILEITITSDPPLLKELGSQKYALEINYKNRDELLFTEVSIPDTVGS